MSPMRPTIPAVIRAYTLVGVLVAAAMLAAPLAGQAQPVPAAQYCEAPIVRREVLRNERGNPIYVSPESFIAQDGELLVAGQFSIEFVRNDKNVYNVSQPNSVLAVVRSSDGTVRTFPRFPMGELLPTALRAVAMGNGSWGVLVHAAKIDPNAPQVVRGTLWFATLTRSGWGAVERVPLPRDVHPLSTMARHMVVVGDRVIAAMTADSGDEVNGVLLVERERGKWRTRFLNTGVASYTALALDGATGELVLGVVRADQTQASDANSLFLMFPDRRNHALRLLVRGGQSPVHHPVMHATSRGISVAWRVHERNEQGRSKTAVQAVVEPRRAQMASRIIAEPAYVTTVSGHEALALVAARNTRADSIYVTLHTLPAPSVGVRLRYSSSFAEVIGAARWSESEIAVGLLAAKDGNHLVNEILWIGTRCTGAVTSTSATDTASSYRSPHHVQPSHSSSGRAAVRERLP